MELEARVNGLIALFLALSHPEKTFAQSPQAQTIRWCESRGNYGTDTGNGYYGAYQFDLETWRSVGGTGLPSEASPAEQDYRAMLLYLSRGWQPWQCQP